MSAGVRRDINYLKKRFDGMIQEVEDAAREGMVEATRGGIRTARRLIEIRGTQGSAKRFAGEYLPAAGPGNSSGRNDSGYMSDSVSAEVYQDGDVIVGNVGWLDDYEEYFGYQEEGFENFKAFSKKRGEFVDRRGGRSSVQSTWTPGMFIWRDVQTLLAKTGPALVGSAVSRRLKKIK